MLQAVISNKRETTMHLLAVCKGEKIKEEKDEYETDDKEEKDEKREDDYAEDNKKGDSLNLATDQSLHLSFGADENILL